MSERMKTLENLGKDILTLIDQIKDECSMAARDPNITQIDASNVAMVSVSYRILSGAAYSAQETFESARRLEEICKNLGLEDE